MDKQCIYDKLDTSIDNLTYKELCKQLDFCIGCDKYYHCNKVAEINDKLVELENSDDNTVKNNIEETYKLPLGTKVRINTDGSTLYTVVSIKKDVLTGYRKEPMDDKFHCTTYRYVYGLEDQDNFIDDKWYKRNEIRVVEN